jgi:hypothetical protein
LVSPFTQKLIPTKELMFLAVPAELKLEPIPIYEDGALVIVPVNLAA